MAKFGKKNRKLRRTIRRTVGALCMITAIVVAAIPFPDAEAGTNRVSQEGLPYQYEYDASGSLFISPSTYLNIDTITFSDSDVNNKIDKENLGGEERTAYTISKVGGNWQMDWQYKYNSESVGKDGYITKYNNQYQVDEIDLKYRVYSDYLYLNQADTEQFYTATDKTVQVNMENCNKKNVDVPTLSHQYELNGDQCTMDSVLDLTKSDAYTFYTNYFKTEYEQYKNAYELYLKDGTQNNKPEPLVRTYRDVYPSDVQQLQFLCDEILGYGTAMTLKFVDKRTYDSEGNSSWEKIYVPCLNEIPKEGNSVPIGGSTYYCDENGFLANSFGTIRGIAKNAFKDITNVRTLTMAPEISFIGNSAFENSFVQSVTFPMGSVIGNKAFKNCTRLREITIPNGIKEIGTEAFYGTLLSNLTLPDSIQVIGPGAFAKCGQLESIQFEGQSTGKNIGDCAFYDCLKLNNVDFGESNILSLGDCCFAVSQVVTGTLSEFNFPNKIESGDKIGHYVLGNRPN